MVVNQESLRRNAEAFLKLSQTTKDPALAASLLKRAADLKSKGGARRTLSPRGRR
jgi:hypothetical protein